jgi:hypothetical protein
LAPLFSPHPPRGGGGGDTVLAEMKYNLINEQHFVDKDKDVDNFM